MVGKKTAQTNAKVFVKNEDLKFFTVKNKQSEVKKFHFKVATIFKIKCFILLYMGCYHPPTR